MSTSSAYVERQRHKQRIGEIMMHGLHLFFFLYILGSVFTFINYQLKQGNLKEGGAAGGPESRRGENSGSKGKARKVIEK